MPKNRNFYTLKEGQALELRGIKNTTLIFLALLGDRYKFKPDELDKLMQEVKFAAANLGDLLTRQDLLDIINKHTEWGMTGGKR